MQDSFVWELYQQHKMFVRERVNKDGRKLVFNALSTLMVISGQRTNKLYKGTVKHFFFGALLGRFGCLVYLGWGY